MSASVIAVRQDENGGLRKRIERAAGKSVLDMRLYASGHNTRLFLADMEGGGRLVAKVALDNKAQMDTEGWMLDYLATRSALPVPKVLEADKDFLLMTWIMNGGPMDKNAQVYAADLLSALHNIRGSQYGLERDTLIGPLYQPNRQSKSWIEFFRDSRLLYMARTALDAKAISAALMAEIEKLAGRLDRFIDKPEAPSLVHGDVWGGNVLSWQGRITGFIDPAIYYADPEIELAFITLFKTFGEPFFGRYHEKRRIRAGFFEGRREIYNLYPLLVHAILFGGGYAASVEKTVRRFL